MPVVTVSCLPKSSEKKLQRLHKAIVRTLVSIKVLNIFNEKDVTCLFPVDMMRYGLGTEIIISVDNLFIKPERTSKVRKRLARDLGMAVKQLFPKAELVECFVHSFDPNQGFWSSSCE
jgi:hypothetical protein